MKVHDLQNNRAPTARDPAVEVTEISARRFPGFPYVHVSAHSRHIQKTALLQSFIERNRAEVAAA
jgi:hypothetical protein